MDKYPPLWPLAHRPPAHRAFWLGEASGPEGKEGLGEIFRGCLQNYGEGLTWNLCYNKFCI
jgi:hypothetical protein